MATYKDILMLVDKVSQPLKNIQKNTEKTQNKIQKLTDKLKTFGKGFTNLGGRVVAFGKKAVAVFAAIGTAVTAMGAAILRGANKYAEMGDRIDKMSQKIGMGKKAFQEWDYIMSQNGGNIETLQMGFKTLVTQIEGVQKGSKDSIKAFKDLGVQVKDNNGKLKSADIIFNDTVRALQKIENPTQKMILANRLFGRSAAELRPLLNQEAEAIDELREKANKMGLILSEQDIKNAVEYKDTMDTFSRFFEAKFAGVMMKIMPDLTKALNEIMEIVAQNQDVFDDLGKGFKWLAGTALPNTVRAIAFVIRMMKKWGEYFGFIQGTILSIPTYFQIAMLKLENIFWTVFIKIKEFIAWIVDKVVWLASKMPAIAKAVGGMSKIIQTQNNNNTTNTYNTTNNYGNTFNGVGASIPIVNVP